MIEAMLFSWVLALSKKHSIFATVGVGSRKGTHTPYHRRHIEIENSSSLKESIRPSWPFYDFN